MQKKNRKKREGVVLIKNEKEICSPVQEKAITIGASETKVGEGEEREDDEERNKYGINIGP